MKTIKKIFTLQKLEHKELFWVWLVFGILAIIRLSKAISENNCINIIIESAILLLSILAVWSFWQFKK